MHFVSYSHLWSWSRHCWSWLQVCVLITGRWKCGSCGSDMPWSRWCFKWCGCSLGTRHWRSSSSCRSRGLALNLVPISSVFWRYIAVFIRAFCTVDCLLLIWFYTIFTVHILCRVLLSCVLDCSQSIFQQLWWRCLVFVICPTYAPLMLMHVWIFGFG